ncbi:MAG: sugar kinase [Desulfovibrionaceae bacterium]|jgi:hypothetical protein|nr:sugar kinase [Desulfovibrionaceae bacterium]
MLGLIGTVPDPDAPVFEGAAELRAGRDGARSLSLAIGGREVDVLRGTPALAAAACAACAHLGLAPPHALLVGDVGLGAGSRALYAHLERRLPRSGFSLLVFHYLQPDVDWHNRVLFAAQAMAAPPLLVADAGFMYAAKMSGQAQSYDLFTPDAGELAFLADAEAPHPFYTRGFILHDETRVPELARQAYAHGDAARLLLVKGATDHVVDRDGVLATVAEPSVEAMEAMGGTGDTLTGLAAALLAALRARGSEPDVARAARLAARVNRVAGALAAPTPATQVAEIVARIPEALDRVLAEEPL